MLYKEYITIKNISLHKVGSKLNQDEIVFSKSELITEVNIKKILVDYFISSFKSEEQYCFYHDVSLSLNEVYTYVSEIFGNPDTFHEQSINLSKHLYNQSLHPKIKSGEFYIVYFKDCILDGETIDAIGLFKSENKDIFLEIEQVPNGFEIESKMGVNINKLEKGCLIYNTGKENGYLVSIIDNINRGNEAQYWKDDFLSIKPKRNEYHQTNQFLSIAKQFVTKKLSENQEVSKTEQIDLLNRSVEYFKTNNTFKIENFEKEVFQDINLIESFRGFDEEYRKEKDLEVQDNFEISMPAVKKQARVFKNVLKLDKNFDIYIHGNKELIEQGVEKDGRKFYKIYYNDEN